MTMFFVTRGIKPADVVNLEPGAPLPAIGGRHDEGRQGNPWAVGRARC